MRNKWNNGFSVYGIWHIVNALVKAIIAIITAIINMIIITIIMIMIIILKKTLLQRTQEMVGSIKEIRVAVGAARGAVAVAGSTIF